MNDVVTLRREGSIAIVSLEEREFKNTFTRRFVEGIILAFDRIHAMDDLKAVVMHGYDHYFCCGGTQEELIGIYEGKLRFNDLQFFDVAMRCKIPVIAAMQGHAIGGGLAFGSYADIIILGKECLVATNFMKYGFTPGMGATDIIPRKFGTLLGTEMLFTARNYSGEELRERGAPLKIVSRDEVIPLAMRTAAELADKPRSSLVLLKERLTQDLMQALPKVIEAEVAMHKVSFAQAEVRKRIEEMFGQ